MSRSVKRFSMCSDQNSHGAGWAKRQACKAVRHYSKGIKDGKWYRKLYNPWNICDYKFFKTMQQAIEEWETSNCKKDQLLTREEVVQQWAKWYRRK